MITGDTPIECSRRLCRHRMFEKELVNGDSTDGFSTPKVCPKCGCDSYYILTERQTANWLKKKVAA